jgi:hypothetical protein
MSELLSDYLGRHELAKALNLNVRTIDNWRDQSKGPAPTFIGRRILYRRKTVEEWLRAQEREHPA